MTKTTSRFLEEGNDEGNFIITFKKDIKENNKITIHKRNNRLKIVSASAKAKDVLDLLDDSNIEFVELDQEARLLEDTIPYNIAKTKAPLSWNATNGSGVKIAVIDSGIAEHSDLEIAGAASFVAGNYTDTYGHGTEVAGVIGAVINNQGIMGVAPGSELYALKAFRDKPHGLGAF